MPEDLSFTIDHDLFRINLNKYTAKAFHLLPELEKPRILDIGCGSGIPTIQLAKLTEGEIVGIDIDRSSLNRLDKRIAVENLSHRVRTMHCSLFDINLPCESFDIIWTEGSIRIIGFDKAIGKWKRLVKNGGFMVIHDDYRNLSKKLASISDSGYKLLNFFPLPEDAWWKEYYGPLEIHMRELRDKHVNDPKALEVIKKEQKLIDMAKKNSDVYRSSFCIIQKDDTLV